MFGILDVYEDLVEDAFIIIQCFNKLNCIANKKLMINFRVSIFHSLLRVSFKRLTLSLHTRDIYRKIITKIF